MKIIWAWVVMAAMTGCAMQATLTVHTQPTGAYITEAETGASGGISPAVFYYNPQTLNYYRDSSGCFVVKGMTAKWVSGATATVNPIRLCGLNFEDYAITINRPADHPDLEKDLQFALQVQALLAQQQQAEAARQAAALQFLNATGGAVKCTSIPIGNQVHTKCK